MCLYVALLHVHILRPAYFQRPNRPRRTVGLENKMFLRVDGGGLHGRDAGEDIEELGVPRGGNGAEEEELVHCRRFDARNLVRGRFAVPLRGVVDVTLFVVLS